MLSTPPFALTSDRSWSHFMPTVSAKGGFLYGREIVHPLALTEAAISSLLRVSVSAKGGEAETSSLGAQVG